MTLLEMAATIAHCDAAMLRERVDPAQRARVLERFSESMARLALTSEITGREGAGRTPLPRATPAAGD